VQDLREDLHIKIVVHDRRKPSGLLDVAVIQSLVRKGVVHDVVGQYGHLIVDECHHLSAQSFEQVVRKAKARFVAGLSATVTPGTHVDPSRFAPHFSRHFGVTPRE
jgi:superfamily II DNA or RNA helicase